MLDILAKDKDRLNDLSGENNKNIKFMVYGAMFHDISTIISGSNHEHNSAIMAEKMLNTYGDKDLSDTDIAEIAKICEGHKEIEDASKLRPEHSNYFACLLHDADALSGVLELDRIFNATSDFYNKNLTIKQRVRLLKENNYLDGDTVNNLILQGYYRRRSYLYITEGAKAIIVSNQSKQQLIDYFNSKEKDIESVHNGKYDFNEMIRVVHGVMDDLTPNASPQNIDVEIDDIVSHFTFKNKIFLLWQILKGFFGSKNTSYPKNIYMSDVHGGYERLVDLLTYVLKSDKFVLPKKADTEDVNDVYGKKAEQIAAVLKSEDNDVNAVYVGGDSVDRGDGQLKTLDLMANIAKAGKLRYVIGNHDLWSFMNIAGIHLPYYENYQGIDSNYTDGYEDENGKVTTVKEFLKKKIEADQKAKNSGIGTYLPRNHATDRFVWAEKLNEYMIHAQTNQKKIWNAKYKEMCALFEKTYGYTLDEDGKDVLNKPEEGSIFKNNDNLRKWWGLLLGHNVGVMVSTGLRAVDKMSINWWVDKQQELKDLREKNYAKTDIEKEAFDAMDKLISEIIETQKEKMKSEVAKNNWMWRVIDAMMYRNYESVEWWAMDWSFHSSWGGGSDGLIAQRNEEIEAEFRTDNHIGPADILTDSQEDSLKRLKLTGATYLKDSRIAAIGKFFKNNFFLYRRDEYGTYMMHSFLPVDLDGDVAIGKVDKGKIEKYDENGKRIKGFYYKGKHYYKKSLFKGLDEIVSDIRKFDFEKGDPSEIIEALVIVNSWYADLTTEIKPTDIRKRHQSIGFGKILARMGHGVMRLIVGHNPVNKSKSVGIHPVEFAGKKDSIVVLSIDDRFSKRYEGPYGKGVILILKGSIGVISNSFESGSEDAIVVASTVVSKDQLLRSVLYDISKPLAETISYISDFYENIISNLFDFIRSELYKIRDVWDKNNTLVVNVIGNDKGIQHSNTNSLTNHKINIVGIELKESNIFRDGMPEDELAESERRLYKGYNMQIALVDGKYLEIPVSFMHRKVRRNKQFANYIGVYVGLEAKKIIKKEGIDFNDDLKNRILYAATATFINESKRKGNLFEKKILPVNSRRKILMRVPSSITDFDASLTDDQKRAMEGVLVAHDGAATRSNEQIENEFFGILSTTFGNLSFTNNYILRPYGASSAIQRSIEESIHNTTPISDMLSAA
jgi:hypothetical protein